MKRIVSKTAKIATVLLCAAMLLSQNIYTVKGSTDRIDDTDNTSANSVSAPARLPNNTTFEDDLRDDVRKNHYSRLGDHRTYGIADDYSLIGYEALFGVRIKIKGKQAHVQYYNHLSKQSGSIWAVNRDTKTTFFQVNTVPINDKVIIDLKKATGYDVDIHFKNEYYEGYGSITQMNGEWYTYINTHPTDYRNVDIYTKYLKSPDHYLDLSDIVYPSYGDVGDVNNVKDWEKLSDELVLNEDWTDQFKVYLFTRYLRRNYAYDRWKCNEGQSRAWKANNWSDPDLFMFRNKVGVCWDFTNVLAIMCRHHGIPATSIDSTQANHTINAIYIDDQWMIIDMTRLLLYYCSTEDPNPDNWESFTWSSYKSYGCACEFSRWGLDQNIWTNENIRNYSSYKDIYYINDEIDKYRAEKWASQEQ